MGLPARKPEANREHGWKGLVANTVNVVWEPHRGQQTKFLSSPAFIVLYGGARGGGKSEALLADACRQCDPNAILPRVKELSPELTDAEAMRAARRSASRYRAVIFRRTLTELEDLIGRAKEKIPQWFPGVVWNEQKKTFTFPSGAIVRFRYLRHKDDWRQYQGWEITYLGFEELTHFNQEAFTKLLPSCRTSDPYLQKWVRATTNPGGVGHAWVRSMFVDAAPWGKIFWKWVGKKGTPGRKALSYQFIPATVYDNPTLMDNDPDYIAILEGLPEMERKAMLEGDWDAFEGQVFAFNRALHVLTWAQLAKMTGLSEGEIPAHWPIFMAMDWGYGKPFSIQWWTVDDFDRAILLREWYGVKRDRDGSPIPDTGLRMSDEAIAQGILEREQRWGWKGRVKMRVADPAMFNPRAISATIQGPPLSEEYANHGVHLTRGDNQRIAGWQQLHRRLELFQLDSEHESPGLFILDECRDWIRTVSSLPADERNVEDVDTKAEDHAADATRYFLMSRPWAPRAPLSERERLRRDQRSRTRSGNGWMAN